MFNQKNFFFSMPKRSRRQLVKMFSQRLDAQVRFLFKASEQVKRASEFAKHGNIQCSLNILNTLDGVFDMNRITSDFLPGSLFLSELQDMRDQIYVLEE